MKPLFVAAMLLLGSPVCTQGTSTGKPATDARPQGKSDAAKEARQAKEKLAAARKLLTQWVEFEQRDRDEATLDKVVDAVMAAETPGLVLVQKQVAAVTDANRKLANAVHTVVCHIALRWLDKVEKSGTVFAGQYGPLGRLMPDVGEFYLELLLETPQWFPVTKRYKVIPALRDLYPKKPDEPIIDKVEAMARDKLEPEYLRVGLSYALAQWGRRDLIKKKLNELETRSRSKHEEIALAATRDLAIIHYDLREYAMAAVHYRDLVRLALAAEEMQPLYYYNLACCLCLSGDKRSALQFLEKALDYNSSTDIDSSVRLERKLFDNDPEIRPLRNHPRIVKAIERAFGKDDPDKRKTPTVR